MQIDTTVLNIQQLSRHRGHYPLLIQSTGIVSPKFRMIMT